MTMARPAEDAALNIKDTFLAGRKHNEFDFPSRDENVDIIASTLSI